MKDKRFPGCGWLVSHPQQHTNRATQRRVVGGVGLVVMAHVVKVKICSTFLRYPLAVEGHAALKEN